jgi:hypothetical protein
MTVGYGNHEPPRTTPAPQPEAPKGPGPATGSERPADRDDNRQSDASTPGAGTLATDPQGNEVDPGDG